MAKTESAKVSQIRTKRQIGEVKFFQKHVIEAKSVAQCSREMEVSSQTLFTYKKGTNFREMALAHLEDSTLNGTVGTINKLVDALDAVRPHNTTQKITKSDGSIEEKTIVEWVADQKTRLMALQEIIKIYGLHAPQKKDVRVAVSISSDADLFKEIDETERSRQYVDSYVKGERGFELAPDPQGPSSGNFKSRKRIVLQDAAVQESQ